MELHALALVPSIIEIAFIDLVLSGDNALVIALATRSLAPELRMVGIVLGTVASLVIRVLATLTVGSLLAIPFLKLAAAVSLLYVAVKLVLPEDEDASPDLTADGLWSAIRLIAVADIAMSIDNVLAVAGVADGSFMLIVFGLVLSMPLLMFGSTLVASILDRVPLLVPIGGVLLGWIAGSIAVSDPVVADYVEENAPAFFIMAPLLGAIFVLMLGRILERQMLERRAGEPGTGPLEDQLPVS